MDKYRKAEPQNVPVFTRRLFGIEIVFTSIAVHARRDDAALEDELDCVVIGAGMAGLAAARQLVRTGHKVTLIEADAEAGGRCRTHFWRGAWRIRGAYAFVESETNLIDEARDLGLYDSALLEDRSEQHIFHILRNGRVHDLASLSLPHLATTSLLTLREKASVAAALPKLLAAYASGKLGDDVPAYDHFHRSSQAFADYVLEPIWGLFCGYDRRDYSLGWLVSLLARHDSAGNSWWTYRDGGVGVLSRALQARLTEDPAVELLLHAEVRDVSEQDGRIVVQWSRDGIAESSSFDVGVVAVPGPIAKRIVRTPSQAQRHVLDRVDYALHDILFAYLDAPERLNPAFLALPRAEGFECASNIEITATDDGLFHLYGETKGDRGGLGDDPDRDAILRRFMEDVARFDPAAGSARIVDAYVQRNDLALPKFKPGYLSALEELRREPPNRLILAGDYLLSTSVGSAHLTD